MAAATILANICGMPGCCWGSDAALGFGLGLGLAILNKCLVLRGGLGLG